MLTSARRSISYPNPDRSDRPDVPAHILNLVNALDVDVVFNIGTDAGRIAATHQVGGGRLWYASDTNILWFDDGTVWRAIGNAPLASPVFTGTPTAPTPATADNSTAVATTAFVKAQGYATTVFGRSGVITAQAGDYTAAQVTNAADKSSASQQAFSGEVRAPDFSIAGLTGAVAGCRIVGATATGAPTTGTFQVGDAVITRDGHFMVCTIAGTPGTWTDAGSVSNAVNSVFGRGGAVVATAGDYSVAQVTGAAPLASPALTGTPTAPTPAVGDNSTKVSTTAFERLLMPPGVILPYGGTAAPNGEWLLCSGQAVSRATYAALYAVVGTAYGAGDGSTTFNVPNMQGRVPVGKDTGTFATLGATGGEQTHVLTVAELATHSHGGVTAGSGVLTTGTESNDHTHAGTTDNDSPDHSHSGTTASALNGYIFPPTIGQFNIGTQSTSIWAPTAGPPAAAHSHSFTTGGASTRHTHTFTSGGRSAAHTHTIASHTHTINADGSSTAHNNLQPYVVTNYIIKT